MRLEQLYYFVSVCNKGSISAASRELHIAQQTLSSSINKLEEEIGAALLHRNKKGIIKTAVGEKFFDFALNTIMRYDEFQNTIKGNVPSNIQAIIRVISSNAYKSSILPALKVYFRKNYPNIKLDIKIVDYEDMLPLLCNYEADLAIGHLAHQNDYEITLLPPNIVFHKLFELELFFWASTESVFAQGNNITPTKLKKANIASLSETDFFLLDELLVSDGISSEFFEVYEEHHMLAHVVENNLAICPDIKSEEYGLTLNKYFNNDIAVALPYKSKNKKQLSCGYVVTDKFANTEACTAIEKYFQLVYSSKKNEAGTIVS
ncbi:MAG: LysR family transcriptional regulator [Peptococcaceae bacterium]|nr:LysR family transcriptional regulator [Peptococcaceae bacterium]